MRSVIKIVGRRKKIEGNFPVLCYSKFHDCVLILRHWSQMSSFCMINISRGNLKDDSLYILRGNQLKALFFVILTAKLPQSKKTLLTLSVEFCGNGKYPIYLVVYLLANFCKFKSILQAATVRFATFSSSAAHLPTFSCNIVFLK